MNWIIYLICFDAGLGMIISNLYIYSNFSMFDVLVIGAIVFELICKRTKIILKKSSTEVGVLILFFSIWQLLSLLVAQGNMLSGLGPFIRNIYFAFIVIFLTPKINSKKIVENMTKYFVLGVLVHFIYVIYLWNMDKKFYSGLAILNNNLLNRNTIYYYAVFAIPLIFYLIKTSQSKLRKIYHLFTLIFVTLIGFFTFSKGAWLLIFLAYLLFLFKYVKRFTVKNLAVIILFVSMLLLILINTGVYKGFIQLQFTDYSAADDIRLIYKKDAFFAGIDNIVFGVGTHNYRDYLIEKGNNVTRDPHDATLMVFAENGIVGLVLYLSIHILCIRKTLLKKRKYENYDEEFIRLAFSIMIIYWVLSFLTGNVFTTKIFLIYLFIALSEYPIRNSTKKFTDRIST